MNRKDFLKNSAGLLALIPFVKSEAKPVKETEQVAIQEPDTKKEFDYTDFMCGPVKITIESEKGSRIVGEMYLTEISIDSPIILHGDNEILNAHSFEFNLRSNGEINLYP